MPIRIRVISHGLFGTVLTPDSHCDATHPLKKKYIKDQIFTVQMDKRDCYDQIFIFKWRQVWTAGMAVSYFHSFTMNGH